MARNKNRIYMAFYARSGHDNYHTAILVSPKNPKPDDNNTWRLHVMNRPSPSRPTQQEWVYDPLQVIGRTSHLLALVLLGKTKVSGQELSEMLGAVEVVQDDSNWDCTTWTLSAIQYMVNQCVIQIPISLESLCDSGSQAAREFSNMSADERNAAAVPTLSSAGEAIISEVM